MDYVIKPPCGMLIDQDRYIGNDPIGHICRNEADYEVGDYFICKDCVEMLTNEPDRITIPTIKIKKIWNEFAKNIKKKEGK